MSSINKIKNLAASQKKWSPRVVDKLYDTYRKGAFGALSTPNTLSSLSAVPLNVGTNVILTNPIGISPENRISWYNTRKECSGKCLTYKIGFYLGILDVHTNEHWYEVYPSNIANYTTPENTISDDNEYNKFYFTLSLPQSYIRVLNITSDSTPPPSARRLQY